MTTIIARLRPRNRKHGQGVGDRDAGHERSATVPATAYMRVLRHQVRNPGVCQTSTRLCHCEGVRPQVAGQRLLVAHQRGQDDEDEGQHEEQRRPRPRRSARATHSQGGLAPRRGRRAARSGRSAIGVEPSWSSFVTRQEPAAAAHQERGEDHATARTARSRRRRRRRCRTAGSRGCRPAAAGSASSRPGSRARTAGPTPPICPLATCPATSGSV